MADDAKTDDKLQPPPPPPPAPPAPAPPPVIAKPLDATPAEAMKATEAVPEPDPPQDPQAENIDAIIRKWTYDHIHGGPIGFNVDAWNHLQASIGHLRDAIIKGI